MSRVLFNVVETDWVRCMETCLKYNRARAPPSAPDKAAFTELITWTWNTTRDPDTLLNYEDALSASFWLSYRLDQNQDYNPTQTTADKGQFCVRKASGCPHSLV